MRPPGAIPEMPEIYFSSGLTRDLEQIKFDLKGQKKKSDVTCALVFLTKIYTHDTYTPIWVCLSYIETDAHSQMHCGGLWKGAAGRGCIFLLNN